MKQARNLNLLQKTRKIENAVKTLEVVHKYIDPNAFIAGGFLIECLLGYDFGHNSDVDIFFKSPNFDYNALSFGVPTLKLLDNFESSNPGVYWYNKSFVKVGTLNGCDLIQYKSDLKPESVVEKFDINICKMYAITFDEYHQCITVTEEAERGLEKKELIVNYKLWKDAYTSKEQAKVTENRLVKYADRFPDFKITELNVKYKPKEKDKTKNEY